MASHCIYHWYTLCTGEYKLWKLVIKGKLCVSLGLPQRIWQFYRVRPRFHDDVVLDSVNMVIQEWRQHICKPKYLRILIIKLYILKRKISVRRSIYIIIFSLHRFSQKWCPNPSMTMLTLPRWNHRSPEFCLGSKSIVLSW